MKNFIPIIGLILWIAFMVSIPVGTWYYLESTEADSYDYQRLKRYYQEYPKEMKPLIDKALLDGILRKWESKQIYNLKEQLDQTKEKKACLLWWQEQKANAV